MATKQVNLKTDIKTDMESLSDFYRVTIKWDDVSATYISMGGYEELTYVMVGKKKDHSCVIVLETKNGNKKAFSEI